MAQHWFDRYRLVYSRWWETAFAGMTDEERHNFELDRQADELRPLSPHALRDLVAEFPALQPEVRDFLRRFGTGEFRFPEQDAPSEPDLLRVFTPSEGRQRIGAISEHAARELEELDEAVSCGVYSCATHGDEVAACTEVLQEVRDRPARYYPLFGPESPYDFIYVVQGGHTTDASAAGITITRSVSSSMARVSSAVSRNTVRR